jgi:hypothetical protein
MEQYKQINTEERYNKLLNSGMFWEFYPELTGRWEVDKKLILPDVVHSKTGLIKPSQLKDIDVSELRELCGKYIDFIDNDEEYSEDNDFSDYIFKKALEVIYGKDIWKFVNERQD